MSKRVRISEAEADTLAGLRGCAKSSFSRLGGKNTYRVRVSEHELFMIRSNVNESPVIDSAASTRLAELESILKINSDASINVYNIEPPKSDGTGKHESVAIILFSDAHVDEVVKKESVLGLNEYDADIAKRRIDEFFVNTAKLIKHAQRSYKINRVVFASLGDGIGGWIHPELEQTNSMSPLSAISSFKSCLLSGLKYLHDNLEIDEIIFVGVIGNHSRTTMKSQFANATDTNLEYYAYTDIEDTARLMGLNKIRFIIPKAESAILELFGKRMLFTHGTNIKYQGGIGGLIVPVSRWFSRLGKALDIDMAFLGHFHQSIFTKRFVINGSLKGYDAYAFGKGLDFEPPQQTMLILHEKYGFTNYTPIFVD